MKTNTVGSEEAAHHDRFYGPKSESIFGSFIFRLFYRKLIRRLKRIGVIRQDANILSLGCGDGHFECMIAPHVASVIGYDISPEAVRAANRRAQDLGVVNFVAREANIMDGVEVASSLPQKYSAVIAIGFLHHLPESEVPRLLANCRKVLYEGGSFASSDPNRSRLVNLLKFTVRKEYAATHTPGERELSPDLTRALLTDSGYCCSRVIFYDFFMGPLAWLIPRCPKSVAVVGDLLDRLLVCMPLVNRLSSAFIAHGLATSPQE